MVFWCQIKVNETKLEQLITLPNFTFCQLFIWIGANNDQIWLSIINGLDEWFWAMFELTPIWSNFSFGQLFMWIGANNDQIWLPMCLMSETEQTDSKSI